MKQAAADFWFLRFFSDGTIDGGFEVRAGCGGEKAGPEDWHPHRIMVIGFG